MKVVHNIERSLEIPESKQTKQNPKCFKVLVFGATISTNTERNKKKLLMQMPAVKWGKSLLFFYFNERLDCYHILKVNKLN